MFIGWFQFGFDMFELFNWCKDIGIFDLRKFLNIFKYEKIIINWSNIQKYCYMFIFGCRYDEVVGVIMFVGMFYFIDGEVIRCRGRR